MKTRRESLIEAGLPAEELGLVSDERLEKETTGSAIDDLYHAFEWRASPQSHRYWARWVDWLDDPSMRKPSPPGDSRDTTRIETATRIMQGLIASGDPTPVPKLIGEAFMIADLMLEHDKKTRAR